MAHYVFDPEEKEYVELKDSFYWIQDPKGKMISPVEYYYLKQAEAARKNKEDAQRED